ncbi:MAG: translation initiation factor IF-3 [Spirochaetes bacterium]|nr:translation initiation factor IF-3 [Spirochaetota bacterium]
MHQNKEANIIDKFDKFRINDEIRAKDVRLVGEGSEAIVLPTSQALEMAKERALDLVEISPNQEPPVVRIVDFSKFKFEQLKKAKEVKKKQKVIHVKEIKMRPNIDQHDFEHKVKHAISFLEKGDKVKFTLMFRGREMMHPDLGFDVMKRIQETLAETAQVEKRPSQEGRNITMVVSEKIGSKKQS